MSNQQMMRAILIEPGKDPSIIKLPAAHGPHDEAIKDTLEGNYGAVEFFQIQPGISLFILVNDLAAALGMKPNRRFPGADSDQIIWGKAIFIAAYNGDDETKEGTLDMSEETCLMFIEQIKLNLIPFITTRMRRATQHHIVGLRFPSLPACQSHWRPVV